MNNKTFNRERGEWPLHIGEKTYKLRLTTNAMAELEDIAGDRTWDQIVMGLIRGSVKDCRLLLWAAFREFHPEIATDQRESLKAIGDLIDDAGGLTAITDQIKAFVSSNGKPEGGALGTTANPPTAEADGTGVPSTPTPSPSA